MDGSGFYALLIWTGIVASAAFFLGEENQRGDVSDVCKSHNEVILKGTVFQCKDVALINQGVRAELK